ncbi:2-C-methyl-D-erythritol 2,4-cyclodiphosphate synthase [Microaceticoccus formicicus]|uniref:2-C-methyl-D-erythritol 2,4-cyclodiphosphate synthase n=1 Tax=Microaceticoccus formicicus TaxID=3118105 RepID=UPI003CD04B74|nr:2-C-methyl-D-erythritol 2,4-cyclodiphosphate synthase [Peptoniphilaceae bacterium AMB_02]
MRIGNGYDVHALVEGRKLILGGVEIEHEKGLLGHSDADVLVHAIMDALLGALALRDIGYHFPDTESEYKDINSLLLLEKVSELIHNRGYRIINIDSTITAQRPKLSPYIDEMRENVSRVLKIDRDLVSIKPTTTEKLGFVGREEGMEAYCVCLVEEIEK